VLEYNALQDMSLSEQSELVLKNYRYYLLIEKPSPLLKCLYAEAVVKLTDGLTLEKIQKLTLENTDKVELMKELNIFSSNAIHFIKDKR